MVQAVVGENLAQRSKKRNPFSERTRVIEDEFLVLVYVRVALFSFRNIRVRPLPDKEMNELLLML